MELDEERGESLTSGMRGEEMEGWGYEGMGDGGMR